MQKNLKVVTALSAAITAASYYLGWIYSCGYSIACYNFTFHLTHPIFYGGLALSIVFVLLIAFPKAYGAWKKFAIWFVPLAALLFVFYPTPGSGDFLTPMPEQLFQWVSALYVVISGIIIAIVKK